MNNEDYLIAFAKGMDTALDKATGTERWAKPVKMPRWIAQKLADARQQRKIDNETK